MKKMFYCFLKSNINIINYIIRLIKSGTTRLNEIRRSSGVTRDQSPTKKSPYQIQLIAAFQIAVSKKKKSLAIKI